MLTFLIILSLVYPSYYAYRALATIINFLYKFTPMNKKEKEYMAARAQYRNELATSSRMRPRYVIKTH